MEVISLCIAVASALVIWFITRVIISNTLGRSKRLPPGPWNLPIIGSLHRALSAAPHRTLMKLSRRHGPLMFLMLGEVPTVVVSSAEAAEMVMRTQDLAFATRPRSATLDIVSCGGKGIAFAPYGDLWRQMRKICVVELLGAKQVKRMESIRVEVVGELLRSVAAAGGGVFNFSEMVSAPINDIISRAVFGGKYEEGQQSEYLRELPKGIELVGGFCLADFFPSSRVVQRLSTGARNLRRVHGRIQRIIADVIMARKALRDGKDTTSTEDQDLLDVLLRLQEDESLPIPLTVEIIGVVIFDIFGAGTSTSASGMEWAMSGLLRNPETMVKAQLEVRQVLGPGRAIITNRDLGQLNYLRMVIKEVLRLHTITPLLGPREAREDCEIMGYAVPKGTKIIINGFAISRDPRYWDNPEAFKPDRFENSEVDYKGTHFQFTPFGAGRRQCPGILFATSTLEIALANLLYHFDWALPDGTTTKSLDMSEKFGVTMARLTDLQLRATPNVCSKAI